jgi:NAD(P)H-hydrate epimerase
MQGLKEFTRYTKSALRIREVYALISNMEALGMNGRILAENAGLSIANALRGHYGKKLLFVCGTGGKGAIGMCAARHAMDHADVTVAVVRSGGAIKNDSAVFNYGLLNSIAQVQDVRDDDISKLEKLVKSADVVVEALIGIGLKGKPSRFLREAIKATNSARHTISIDVPAGVNADTGVPSSTSIRADELFVVHKNKAAVACKLPGCKSKIIDVGIPASMELIAGPGDVMLATEPRSMRANKYDTGAVLVVGGSAEYHGAPLLSAFSALRTGSGYVTLAAPRSAAIKLKEESPNLAVRMLSGNIITHDDVETVCKIRHDSLTIGSGMSPTKESFETILEIISRCDTPMVLDAAALRAVALDKSVLNERMVLTPHEGEFEALSGIKLDNSPLYERIRTVVKFADTYGCTLVLKGNDTIITDGKLLKVNKASSPALATMGTGDALSGMIASYLSRHKNVFECAVAAVHAHAKAGDLLFAQKGIHITATDVVDAIPYALKTFDVVDADANYGEVPSLADA